MVRLTLPGHLFALLPEEERARRCAGRSVMVSPGPWSELVQELRARFPLLERRVLTESARLASGFALVVNDEVVRDADASLQLRGGDEITIITAIAGG